MSKNPLADQFSADLDAYLQNLDVKYSDDNDEYKELMDLGKALADKDFSRKSRRQYVFNKTQKRINEPEGVELMKIRNKRMKTSVTAACLAFTVLLSFGFMQTSFAKSFTETIINVISLGHIKAVQSEVDPDLAKQLKSQYSSEEIRSAKSTKIDIPTKSDSTIYVAKDLADAEKYTSFPVAMPQYLPEGYAFGAANLYKDHDGKISGDYLDLYFVNKQNGDVLFIQERAANEATAYEEGTDGKIEKIKINGNDAILMDGKNLDWEANNVLFGMSGKNLIPLADIEKIAASMK